MGWGGRGGKGAGQLHKDGLKNNGENASKQTQQTKTIPAATVTIKDI